ncbi:GNAT family N-acetyltransferase [Microlunatus sp. GCM10028923]|uniref:GNAT family N-acetyltransferase n=1 Tax=Microlunatus sp. GCM10028923 TaxID=3273400 RepID=UPI00360EF526
MITLRTATRADLPVIADILANVQGQADPALDVEAQRTALAADLENWFGRDEPESLLSIIELDGVPVGRLRVVRWPDRIFLGGIQVHPDHQERGIGTELITALIEEARASGRELQLTVDKINIGARRLYQRLGFRTESETVDELHLVIPVGA